MAVAASAVNTLPISNSYLQDVHLLQEAIALLTRAADQGQDTLFSEARILFRNALSAVDARIVVRSAAVWREWNPWTARILSNLQSQLSRIVSAPTTPQCGLALSSSRLSAVPL
jgi:hypothetical protein